MAYVMEVPLQNLIQNLKNENLNAAIIPSWDEWDNEIVEDRYNRLKAITNFSGSNGIAIIDAHGKKSAFLTDGRYTIQAKQEVSAEYFEIMQLEPKNIVKCLSKYKNYRVGFDVSIIRYSYLLYLFNLYPSLEFVPVQNLIPQSSFKRDKSIKTERKTEQIPDKDAGASFLEKKSMIFEELDEIKPNGYDYVLFTSPDIISWILNIRATDKIAKDSSSLAINCYMMLKREGEEEDIIYVDDKYIVSNSLSLSVKGLEEVISDIKGLVRKKLYITRNTPYIIAGRFINYLQENDVLSYKKCIKNQTECENIAAIHKIDGAILTQFLSKLSANSEIAKLDEFQVSQMLTKAREENEKFICNSFAPIVGSGSNGAIIHYKPSRKDAKKINSDELLLIDSGGHYRWGTTDVTRTIKLSKPTDEERKLFTKVLQGFINVFLYQFNDATGKDLDDIARKPLNSIGYDYPHSTGHGVGYAINVHEGPISISQRYMKKILPGMVLSVEPGVYLEGKFGIRIENLALVKQQEDGKCYLANLTWVPIQMELVDINELSDAQKNWLIDYNKRCDENYLWYYKS